MNRPYAAGRAANSANQSLMPHLIKNMRLLDLDEEFDWPYIAADTFAATSPAAQQRERIQAAEWILYKLLELWDPKETKENMQDFFPAFEPKQSTLLRACLYKALAELKRESVLHRDITVRKTMLDECKGPKFEELLATLSSLVLQKTLIRSRSDQSTVRRHLCGQAALDASLKQPLTIAYQASCSAQLRRRYAYEKRWAKFGRVLKSKKEELERRERKLEDAALQRREKKMPKRMTDRLRRAVDANWAGDTEWPEILLRSDKHRPQNTMLERPFDDVWSHVCADTLFAIRPERTNSVLQDLESRVEEQNLRIERWRSIRDSLIVQAEAIAYSPAQADTSGSFVEDEDVETPSWATDPVEETHEAVKTPVNMSPSRSRIAVRTPHRRTSSSISVPSSLDQTPTSSMRDRSALEPSITFAPPSAKATKSPLRRRDPGPVSSPTKSPARRKPLRTYSQDPLTPPPSRDVEQPESRPRTADSRFDSSGFDDGESFEDDDPARQIISDVLNAEPTPAKAAPLSLAERTRLSMARLSPQKMDMSAAPPPRNASPDRNDSNVPMTPDRRAYESLAERTRRSMSLMSAARPKQPPPSAAAVRRRRASRTSNIYPINQFETPHKARMPGDDTIMEGQSAYFDETTMMEEEFLDPELVFKSRPKIAQSPVLQPAEPEPLPKTIEEAIELDRDDEVD